MPTQCASPAQALFSGNVRGPAKPASTDAASEAQGAIASFASVLREQRSQADAKPTTTNGDNAMAAADEAGDAAPERGQGELAALIAAFLPHLQSTTKAPAEDKGKTDASGSEGDDSISSAPAGTAAIPPTTVDGTPDTTEAAAAASSAAIVAGLQGQSSGTGKAPEPTSPVERSANAAKTADRSAEKTPFADDASPDDDAATARLVAAANLAARQDSAASGGAAASRGSVADATQAHREPAARPTTTVETSATVPTAATATTATAADHDFATLLAARQSDATTQPATSATPGEGSLRASEAAAASAAATHGLRSGHEAGSVTGRGPALAVDTPVGQPGWPTNVGDRLTWMADHQQQRADLVLNPPQLGRIEVSLSIREGQATALFVSANPEVRDAISNALPQLREVLAGAGINLGQAQVDSGSAGASADARENGDNRRGSAGGADASGTTVQTLRGALSPRISGGRGLVDVFA